MHFASSFFCSLELFLFCAKISKIKEGVMKMITNQIIQTSINALTELTKVEICIADSNGEVVASTLSSMCIEKEIIIDFAASPVDSQIVSDHHMMKIVEDGNIQYVILAKGMPEITFMITKIAVSQLQNLIIAYKEKFDRNIFFQNLILDNLLLVDIYNRAKKLRIEVQCPRVVFLIETKVDNDKDTMEMLRSLYSCQGGDYITAVDERNIILIKAINESKEKPDLNEIARTIVDMMNTEAMIGVKVSYGTVVAELKEISKSYKEAKMALAVGKIFYLDKDIVSYETLGIGRLIYRLPVNLCEIFIREIFDEEMPIRLEEEMVNTIHTFFDNDLNISETARQLFVHRNTLVNRIEKMQNRTGLDIRKFEDALTLKIALMVVEYMYYLDNLE